MASRPSIGAVLVNWNARQDILDALTSLEGQSEPIEEIVVVDNGSKDGSIEAIRAGHPEVHVLATGENLGFGEGCNRGISLIRSDWVFLLNNDAIANPDCIERLRDAAQYVSDDVGMIQPLLVFRQNPEQ